MFDFPEKIRHGCFTLSRILKQGARGIEPPTSRSTVECSTTELRSLKTTSLISKNVLFKTIFLAFLNRKLFFNHKLCTQKYIEDIKTAQAHAR